MVSPLVLCCLVATGFQLASSDTPQAASTLPLQYLGCFLDRADPMRDMPDRADFPSTNTPQLCIQRCVDKKMPYAAVQNGYACFCGSSYGRWGARTGCDVGCPGNSSIACGAHWANSVYLASSAPVYMGCFLDRADPLRDLPDREDFPSTNTPQLCIERCLKKNMPYAAVQNGYACFCGSSYGRWGARTGCDVGCPGNGAVMCGAHWANSVYLTSTAFAYVGCFLDKPEPDFQDRTEFKTTNTPHACISHCLQKKMAYAAVQNGNLCFCGSSYGRYGPSSECTVACTGDSSFNCGGPSANLVFKTGYV